MEPSYIDKIRINDLWVDFSTLKICLDGQWVEVEAKLLCLLKLLLDNHGKPVSRQQIMDALWHNTIVSDNSVNQAITQLRKILRDDRNNTRFIRTVPRIGYQLIADIDIPDNSAPAPFLLRYCQRLSKIQTAIVGLIFGALCTVLSIYFIHQWHQVKPIAPDYIYESRLTSVPGAETFLSYSPDGRYLAFSQTSLDRSQMDLVVYDTQNQAIHSIRNTGYSEEVPTWSPDGKWLAYIRHDPYHCDVRVMAVASPIETWRLSPDFHLTNCTSGYEQQKMFWPVAQTLYKVQWLEDIEKQQLFRVSLSVDGLPAEITQQALPYQPEILDIDPQGKNMLIVEKSANKYSLKLVDLSTEKQQLLQQQNHSYWGLSWHNNNSYWLGNESLQLVNLQGQRQIIHKPMGFIPDLDLNEKSGQLAYAEGLANVNWHQLSLTGAPQPEITYSQKMSSSARFDILPTLSDDGSQTAFVSYQRRRLDGTQHIELWLKHKRKKSTSLLVNLPTDLTPTYLLWSPNNENILLGDTEQNVYLINTLSKHMLPIISGFQKIDQVRWSDDGKYIYYSSFNSSTWQNWQYDIHLSSTNLLSTGEKPTIPIERLTPTHLDFKYRINAYLRTQSLAEDILEQLTPSLKLYRPAITDVGIYYVIKFGHELRLYLYSFNEKRNYHVTLLGIHEHDLNITLNVSASKNAMEVVYSQLQGLETDIFVQRKVSR